MKIIYLLVVFFFCYPAQAQLNYPEAKIETHIFDETGNVISNATVTIWFTTLKTNNPWDGQEDIGLRGISNSKGVFVASHKTLALCGIKVEKDGYYAGRAEFHMKQHQGNEKWTPWPQIVEIKLRKKVLPISMYAKTFDYVTLPEIGNPVGFDLTAGDWVAPHGKGVVKDLIFTFQREFRGRFDFAWNLSVDFQGDGNGWQAISIADENPQSEFRYPRSAPGNGYSQSKMYLACNRTLNNLWETNSTSATNYFFRIRTQYGEKKEIKSALYGKLLGPIVVNVQSTKTAKLNFTYYLNPTPLDRNMEFDPEKNLFKSIPWGESVREP